jgi:hypothetical protein
MARSVVRESSPRCTQCLLPPRWCVCGEARIVKCPLKTSVLMHHQETWRPTSTGRLLKRVMPACDLHLYRRGNPPERTLMIDPDKTLWILHPRGKPVPANATPKNLQILLLDGNWRQAGEMMHAVGALGNPICLPPNGASRYWLRKQTDERNYCTAEALIFLLDALGFDREQIQLRLQFELHVYAGLRARGAKVKARQYLETSPVRDALTEMIGRGIRHRLHDANVRDPF